MKMVQRDLDKRDDVITREAVRLYRAMEECECTCPEHAWDEPYEECAGCLEWTRLHGLLHSELKAKPWQWPVTKVAEFRRLLEAALEKAG